MCSLRNSAILFLLVSFHLNLYGDTQLIGEEKKYVFLEQALLERVRSTLLEITKALEERVERLEEELKNRIPMNPATEPLNGCPGSDNCAVVGLKCPRLVMDPVTLYNSFLSSDKLTLLNTRLDSSYDWPAVTDRKYHGAQGSSVITNQQIVYFETDIYYRIEKNLSMGNLVFEVAFATENAIGSSFYVGHQKRAWSIYATCDETKGVILSKGINGGQHMYIKTLSDATSGTEKYLKLGFYINRVDRTIAVFDINMNTKIYTFVNVDESQELWPVFGVYNHDRQLVRLRLNSERDIAKVPCGRPIPMGPAITLSHHVGRQNEAWSINAHNFLKQEVTLLYSNGIGIKQSESLSDATYGTENNLNGFFNNRIDGTIVVFDINMNRKIYLFTNVDRSQELWPVFGVYQVTKTFVRLRLNSASDITVAPCELFLI